MKRTCKGQTNIRLSPDGMDYTAIYIPIPVNQLEAQNRNLAINVFGSENNSIMVRRIRRKEANVPRLNLVLIEGGWEEKQHDCM